MSILLMVTLSAVSLPGAFSWSNLIFLSLRLGFFPLIRFLIGIYALPTILSRIHLLVLSLDNNPLPPLSL